MGSCRLLLCCESISEERSAGNPHATFCGSRERVTAPDDPVEGDQNPLPIPLRLHLIIALNPLVLEIVQLYAIVSLNSHSPSMLSFVNRQS